MCKGCKWWWLVEDKCGRPYVVGKKAKKNVYLLKLKNMWILCILFYVGCLYNFLINIHIIYLAIYCRPTTSNKINFSFTPLLLKTIELSYIARRPSMITKVLVKPQFTLKPAEHENRKQNIKSVKQKNVQFKIPEISCNS